MGTTGVTTARPHPTFIFIGADRCGSKWLHQIFMSHPDCFVPTIADPYFFDRQYHRGIDWYWDFFKDTPSSALAVGEFSHDYIHSRDAARRIHNHLPEVRILATLRHPVGRAYSDWSHSHTVGLAPASFDEALEAVPTLIENSLYSKKLLRYFDLFGRENVHVMLYDRLLADPRGLATDAFAFLGLREVDEIDFERVYNPFRVGRGALGGKIARRFADLLRSTGQEKLLGSLRRSPVVRSVFFKDASDGERPSMNPDTRTRLLRYFESEITALEQLLEQDLSAWRT